MRTLHVMNLHDVRIRYEKGALDAGALPEHPMALFAAWLREAVNEPEPNAAALGTVDYQGHPSVRYVLLKEVRDNSVVFFTNYESRKGQHLTRVPVAALTFWWPTLERQVRLEGLVQRLPAEESDAYFAERPLESRIGAAASPQSEVIASREVIDERAAALRAEFGEHIVRPASWGGYEVMLERYEFWQGRAGRMHDRFEALPNGDAWSWRRLAP